MSRASSTRRFQRAHQQRRLPVGLREHLLVFRAELSTAGLRRRARRAKRCESTESIRLMRNILSSSQLRRNIRFMPIDASKFRIGDLATVQGGFPFRGSIDSIAKGSVLAVQMKDLKLNGEIEWEQVVRTELLGRRSADWLAAGDILFVCRGARFYAGCVDDPPGRAVCSPHFFHLRVLAQARVVPAFLTWLINQSPVQRQLRQAAEGSNQLSIRRPILEAINVRIPSFVDQQRIVSLARLAHDEQKALQQLIHNREIQLDALAEALCAD
jgi:hypothetical protein